MVTNEVLLNSAHPVEFDDFLIYPLAIVHSAVLSEASLAREVLRSAQWQLSAFVVVENSSLDEFRQYVFQLLLVLGRSFCGSKDLLR